MKLELIPVRLSGVHEGVVVMHTPEEYAQLWRGVDREAAELMARPLDDDGEAQA